MTHYAPSDLQHESAIVWLHDPSGLDYVRQVQLPLPGRFQQPRWEAWYAHLGVLVGYSTVGVSAPSINGECSMRRILWLKTTDRPFDPAGVYAGCCPPEAVDPATVKPRFWGIMNDRARGITAANTTKTTEGKP